MQQNQIAEYKGYEIVSIRNKKIVSQIKNNLHRSETTGFTNQINLMYEPPIVFVHENYESMLKFMDENPQ